MIIRLRGLLLFQAMLFIGMLVTFYFSAFLAGYGSNKNHLGEEKNMFFAFALANLLLNLLYLMVTKKLKRLEVAATFFLVFIFFSISYLYFYT